MDLIKPLEAPPLAPEAKPPSITRLALSIVFMIAAIGLVVYAFLEGSDAAAYFVTGMASMSIFISSFKLIVHFYFQKKLMKNEKARSEEEAQRKKELNKVKELTVNV